jgi:uncharacterized protein
VTAQPILETLAREYSAGVEHVQNALEMLDAGLSAPFIGRFRRDRVGALSESSIRRLHRRRQELEELDRRRGTILRLLEHEAGMGQDKLAAIQSCMDRFELEDLFIPHRRPEPEVQLALDRGLGGLANLLVAPIPKAERASIPGMEAESDGEADADDDDGAHDVAPSAVSSESASSAGAESTPTAVATSSEPAHATIADAPLADAAALADATPLADTNMAGAHAPETTAAVSAQLSADGSAAPEAAETAVAVATETANESSEEKEEAPPAPTLDAPHVSHAHVDVRTAMNAQLARVCQPFVRPDKGIHTESEALSGALRILSDRLGRDSRLRGAVRRILAKHGVLTVRATVDESRLGRHRSLLKVRQPLRQLQGHRLLAIRQAQKERVLNTVITLDPAKALAKVRAALGRHTHPAHVEVLNEVALQALNHRLLPMVEQDIRLELKERADGEALRFLSQHLRQLLLTPALGRHAVAGVDVSAKGDWTIAVVDADGNPAGTDVKIEVGAKEPGTLGAELDAALAPHDVRFMAIGHGKGPRAALNKLRAALRAPRSIAPAPPPAPAAGEAASATPAADSGASAPVTTAPAPEAGASARVTSAPAPQVGASSAASATHVASAPRSGAKPPPFVFVVNESGLSSYASSDVARRELDGKSVPVRMAISLARRLQDPLSEILKVDPRHLGLGLEQGLVSKANARRAFTDTIESCTAHVGCDVNRASLAFLQHLPGIDRAAAQKIVARRAEKPFQNREELRADGLLTEAQWTSAVAFMRVNGDEPLDGTGLHPEQYPLVRRMLDSIGMRIEQGFGRPGATKGLRRTDFEVDEITWRDLMREIAFPGRDPRMRLHAPALLEPDTDPVRLVKDRVLEGVVSNVASFGTFIDVGLAQDAMVHISEISDRYVRDARELLSVGQVVRARILDASTPRLALSLKNVPWIPREGARDRTREGGPPRHGAHGDRDRRPMRGREDDDGRRRGRGGRGRDHGEREEQKPQPFVRAAQSRRDGLGVRASRGRGGRGGDRDGGPRRRGGAPDHGGDAGERVRLDSLNAGSKPAFSPFASFFKAKQAEKTSEES